MKFARSFACLVSMALLMAYAVTANSQVNAGESGGKPVVRVKGNRLIDAQGKVMQFRGVNVSGLEFTHINGQPEPDGWGGQKPNLKAIKSWNANAIRVPLNEASYLGLVTYDLPQAGGKATERKADPSGRYKQLVRDVVDEATSLGFYVILDLHK